MSEPNEEPTPGASPLFQAPPPAPTPAAPPAPKATEQDPATPEKVEDLPDWAQKQIRDLRKEAAGSRTKATKAQQDAFREAARAVGFEIPDDGTVEPEKLTADLEAQKVEARTAKVELAVYRNAIKHSADADALLDSRAFLAKVTDLDPADAEFNTKVEAAIKAALTDNPKLRAAQAAGTSSVDHAGGPGETTDATSRAKPGVSRLRAAYETAR